MKQYFPKKFIIGVLLYLAVGVIVGMSMAHDIAGEDLWNGTKCQTWPDCQSQNAYLIPAGMVIWPLYIVSNPLLLAMVVLIAGLLFWLTKKPKTATTRKS